MIITGANGEEFLNNRHGWKCQVCHGGAEDGEFETMAEAHAGMTDDPNQICASCHTDIAKAMENSLHANLWGEVAAIELRSGVPLAGSAHEEQYKDKCASCHATCGQCHITRPQSVGGGFPKIGSYYSHRFRKTPDMNEQCTVCHGSRVGVDYKGELEGNAPDVHRTMGYRCEYCHSGEEMHGDGQYTGDHYNGRYEVATMPRCEKCHTPMPNPFHTIHGPMGTAPRLQCQACHSQPYKNCTNCHELGSPGFTVEPSVRQFKIARNNNPNRPEYDYAVVRHTPIDPGTYSDWGLGLPNYLAKSTWQYASPHNILRWTDQTSGSPCYDNCHNTPDGPDGYFLRESDLYEADGVTKLPDYDANIGIVVTEEF